MKLRDILRPIGAVAGFIHPGIGAAISVVNQFLPEEDKVPQNATPEEVNAKIATLPPDQQASIYEKEIDLKLAEVKSEVDRYEIMTRADSQSTRPKIALLMAYAVCWLIVLYTGIIIYAIHTKTDMSTWWPLFGVIIAVPAEVLRNYFGNLRKEQGNRLGIPQKSIWETIKGSK